jgi:hypothetical protein
VVKAKREVLSWVLVVGVALWGFREVHQKSDFSELKILTKSEHLPS